jgi:hypothetical protein
MCSNDETPSSGTTGSPPTFAFSSLLLWLTVSCNLDGAATKAAFEGVTATKGFVDYWHPVMSEEPPPAPATATLFHVISEDSED